MANEQKLISLESVRIQFHVLVFGVRMMCMWAPKRHEAILFEHSFHRHRGFTHFHLLVCWDCAASKRYHHFDELISSSHPKVVWKIACLLSLLHTTNARISHATVIASETNIRHASTLQQWAVNSRISNCAICSCHYFAQINVNINRINCVFCSVTQTHIHTQNTNTMQERHIERVKVYIIYNYKLYVYNENKFYLGTVKQPDEIKKQLHEWNIAKTRFRFKTLLLYKCEAKLRYKEIKKKTHGKQ